MWDDHRQLNFIAGMLTAFSVVMLGVALVAWGSRHPAFAIRHVVFTGDVRHVNPGHLRAIVADELAGTFFTLNLDRARLAFAAVPWVREVGVRRRWPDRLEVTLQEYQPLARWNETALVDTEGSVFDGTFDGELPHLSGPDETSLRVVGAYRRFAAAVAPLGRSIDELRLSERLAWTIRLDNGLSVTLGRDDTDARFERFVASYRRAVAPLLENQSLGVDIVDMRYRNGFAVHAPGFREPSPKRKT